MFDYNSFPIGEALVADFKMKSKNEAIAYHKLTNSEMGSIIFADDGTPSSDNAEVMHQYELWCKRPERKVGKLVNLAGRSLEQLMTMYEELLIGAMIMQSEDSDFSGYAYTIDWLRTTDFYRAPASTQYHENFPGGLLVHSLNVYNKMLYLRVSEPFRKVDLAQATIVALTHDWCKIDYYESYQKNVKNEKTGQWEKETAYKVNQKGIPLGHGVSSLYLAMTKLVLKLTDEQALALRWHMNVWNVADVEKSELQKANSTYPMVYLIQFADQLACTEYPSETDKEK